MCWSAAGVRARTALTDMPCVSLTASPSQTVVESCLRCWSWAGAPVSGMVDSTSRDRRFVNFPRRVVWCAGDVNRTKKFGRPALLCVLDEESEGDADGKVAVLLAQPRLDLDVTLRNSDAVGYARAHGRHALGEAIAVEVRRSGRETTTPPREHRGRRVRVRSGCFCAPRRL